GCAHLVWVDGSVGDRQTSPCTGDVQSNSPPGVNGEVEVNYGPAFDFVDEILCLSPIDHVEEPPSSLGDFIQSCQTFSEEQMQEVKSKVVLPVSQKLEVHTEPAAAVCPSARLPPWQQPERQARSASQLQGRRDAKRPAVFDRDENWEREKQLYVDSVTRHIVDNTGVGDGVVTELLHLMSAVANQETGRDGSQWQHPSDLTRRYTPFRSAR
ncbi:hypothetical protein P4O66_013930, partial [Electrophorus voltai]